MRGREEPGSRAEGRHCVLSLSSLLTRHLCPVSPSRPPVFPDGAEQGVGEAKGTRVSSRAQGQLKANRAEVADSGQTASDPEVRGASRWGGWVERRMGREDVRGVQSERWQFRQETSMSQGRRRRIAGRRWVSLTSNVPLGKEQIFKKVIRF